MSLPQILTNAVHDGGGQWHGTQESMVPYRNPEVVFSNPATGHILRQTFTPDLVQYSSLIDEVRHAIATDNEAHARRTVKVSVYALKQLSIKLLKLSEEIAALYEEKQ